jgi:dihydrofolate reductase
VSLDGFIARQDGSIDWLVPFGSEEAAAAFNEFESRVDAIVMGRGTFETVLKFPDWPYRRPVFVLSSRLKQVAVELQGRATILSMPPRGLLQHLTNEGFSRLYVDGGRVIQSFLREDLVDELIIAHVPVIIGSGIPLFSSLHQDLRFTHVRTIVFTNGVVQTHYERERT